jgi:hypothetical protein
MMKVMKLSIDMVVYFRNRQIELSLGLLEKLLSIIISSGMLYIQFLRQLMFNLDFQSSCLCL